MARLLNLVNATLILGRIRIRPDLDQDSYALGSRTSAPSSPEARTSAHGKLCEYRVSLDHKSP